jgi:Dihaem cytochrome c
MAMLFAAALLAACQNGKIPPQDSYQAQLYVRKCGQCHQPYNPSLMTSAMWMMQMDSMQQRMEQAGLPPLSPEDRKTILGYLTSHAGHQ